MLLGFHSLTYNDRCWFCYGFLLSFYRSIRLLNFRQKLIYEIPFVIASSPHFFFVCLSFPFFAAIFHRNTNDILCIFHCGAASVQETFTAVMFLSVKHSSEINKWFLVFARKKQPHSCSTVTLILGRISVILGNNHTKDEQILAPLKSLFNL